jgi:hypothetical protein
MAVWPMWLLISIAVIAGTKTKVPDAGSGPENHLSQKLESIPLQTFVLEGGLDAPSDLSLVSPSVLMCCASHHKLSLSKELDPRRHSLSGAASVDEQ